MTDGASHQWEVVAYAYALVMALGIGYFLVGIPLQLTDSVALLLDAQRAPSVWALVHPRLDAAGFLRPLYWAQVKVLFDLSGGHYQFMFRGFHLFLVVVALLLFVRLLRVHSAADAVALPVAFVILVGSHTFLGTVWEAFPVNHYLEILVACLLVVNLSLSRGGWWIDVTAILLTAAALLTLESGVLVWLCVAVIYATGGRSVSRRALLGSTLLVAAYFTWRFAVMRSAWPGLEERSSGFLLARLDPPDLERIFAGREIWFYAYNVASSILTVLFSEPRAGEFVFFKHLIHDWVPPWIIINLVSSGLTTLLLGWFVAIRLRSWSQRQFSHGDRIAIIFLTVLVANAAVSFGYTKDIIMSPAGAFYAAAVFFAVRELFVRCSQRPQDITVAAVVLVAAFVASAAWSVRAAGLPYNMRHIASDVRSEWARADRWLAAQDLTPRDARGRELVEALRTQAIELHTPNPSLVQSGADRYVDQRR